MERGLVTIVIPVYNGTNFMRDAIDSALHQTYKNCEVMVINDGSTDKGETEKIALSYGEKIRYFRKENGGTASALNYAIDRMKGEYFAWLSHDDIYYPNKILRQIQWMKKHKCKFSFCDYHILRENGSKSCIIAEYCYPKKYLNSGVLPVVNGMIQFGGVLLHKSVIDKYGKFDEQLRTTQDFEYLFRISKKINSIYIPEILYAVRIHQQQGTNTIPTVCNDADNMYQMFLEQIGLKEKEKSYGSNYGYYYQMLLNIWPQKHLKHSLRTCIQYLFKDKSIQYIENKLFEEFKHKRIYIYGAGNYGRRLLLDMQIRGIKVEGFIDKKNKENIVGIPCITLDKAESIKDDICIIVSALVVDEMIDELTHKGFNRFMTKSQFDILSIENPPPKYKVLPTMLNHYYKVGIYGAGEYGIKNYFLLKDSGVNISFFCDRDLKKHGILLDGVKCISLEEMKTKEKENLVIFICIKDSDKLREEFKKASFPHVYTNATIENLISANLLDPYQNTEKLDLSKPDSIDKINLFRNQLVHETSNAYGINNFNSTHSFEKMLKDVLINENERKKNRYS